MYVHVKGLRSVEVNIALRKRDNDPGILELVVYRLVKFAGGLPPIVHRAYKTAQHNR
jgi:hypothetical protein